MNDFWQNAAEAILTGDVQTLDRILREHEQAFRERQPEPYPRTGLCPSYAPLDARTIIVNEHQFKDFAAFEEYQREMARADSPVARFEAAVEAALDGDAPTLARLLRAHPDLINVRSTRRHRATLLHYMGANGVESFRQRTPANAVEITRMILDAGAEVDTFAQIYGDNDTALGLAATSYFPLEAGVQNELIDLLLGRGAAIDYPGGGSLINACLANGRGAAAAHLALRGARLDLEGAGGVGRLDIVQHCINSDGSPKPGSTEDQLKSAFAWACEYGHIEIVKFLLDRGFPIATRIRNHGQTGLHWATLCAHADIVTLLLERGSPIEAEDEAFKSTPLGWALHGFQEHLPGTSREPYYNIVAQLMAAGAKVRPAWLQEENIRGDARMVALLGGK